MKPISRGEWQYALLLILLLVLAAVASVSTVSYIEGQIVRFEYNRAVERLQDYLAFEQRKLADLVQYAATVGKFAGRDVDQFFDRVARAEEFAQLDLSAVALIEADGQLLGCRFISDRPLPDDVAKEDFLGWGDLALALQEDTDTWVGFGSAAREPVLIALARVTEDSGISSNAPLVALVRPLTMAYLRKIQQTFPAFGGLAPPTEVVQEGAHLEPIEDLAGRKVGAFVFRLDLDRVERAVRNITLAIHGLTMGLLFLAGALGLWAIRSTTQVESMRRVGRFVDAMDYLPDGLLALDMKGRVTGANPAGRRMVGRPPEKGEGVRDMFPVLSEADERELFHTARPSEVEKLCRTPFGQRIWRFRSQPSEDMNLLLVSDVTDQRSQEMRRRQVAALQMIGRIARGVAHDFNNILCAISGHASLLSIPDALDEEGGKASVRAIVEEAQRGATLAAHLLELSRSRKGEEPSDRLVEHVEKAAEVLRVGLSSGWEVVTEADQGFPAVPLSAVQIQQVVLNLGLLVADALGRPGVVRVAVRRPTEKVLPDVGDQFGAVVVIDAQDAKGAKHEPIPPQGQQTTAEEAGVIQSVVRTMLEEVAGRLDILLEGGGRHVFRVCLPPYVGEEDRIGDSAMPEEWATYVGKWQVLLALPESELADKLTRRLESLGTTVESAPDIVGALSKVERDFPFTAVVFDKELLGAEAEADGLLRAILKLQPTAGFVVLCDNADTIPSSLTRDVIFETREGKVDGIVEAMIRSREVAAQRKAGR